MVDLETSSGWQGRFRNLEEALIMDLIFSKMKYSLGILLVSIAAGYLISLHSFSVLILIGLLMSAVCVYRYFDTALLFLIFYLPFQVALNISSGIDLASGRVFILILLAVWLIKGLAQKKVNINFSLQIVFLSLFLFVAGFSMLWAFEDERAARKILVFLSIFPLYFVISSFDGKRFVYKVLDALFLGAFLISLIGLAQFAAQFILGIDPVMEFWSETIAPIFYGNEFGAEVVSNPSWLVNVSGATLLRVFSLFPDPHMFSFYMGLILPILISFGLFYGKDCGDGGSLILRSRTIVGIIIFIMILSEALTFSRGGYIGMVAGLGILIILGWKYFGVKKKFIIGSFFAILTLFGATNGQSFVARFVSSFDLGEGSNSERMKNWGQGYEMFADNLFFGVGIGNYSYELKPTADYRTPIYAHNTYLDIGAEMGIFALFAWIMLFGASIYGLYRAGKYADNIGERALSFGLVGSLVWFLTHSFFDTAIYSPTVLSILMVILAVAATINAKCKNQNVK
ncbi:MAG: O-antigen ligase family protein [Candidatus Paceibacterota bacterium]|jgi:hypothetical protein